MFASGTFDGLDGEIIVGPATAEDVYRVTNSAVMSRDGEPDFTYWLFDKWCGDGCWVRGPVGLSHKAWVWVQGPRIKHVATPRQGGPPTWLNQNRTSLSMEAYFLPDGLWGS